jgi:hypothetical protein
MITLDNHVAQNARPARLWQVARQIGRTGEANLINGNPDQICVPRLLAV